MLPRLPTSVAGPSRDSRRTLWTFLGRRISGASGLTGFLLVLVSLWLSLYGKLDIYFEAPSCRFSDRWLRRLLWGAHTRDAYSCGLSLEWAFQGTWSGRPGGHWAGRQGEARRGEERRGEARRGKERQGGGLTRVANERTEKGNQNRTPFRFHFVFDSKKLPVSPHPLPTTVSALRSGLRRCSSTHALTALTAPLHFKFAGCEAKRPFAPGPPALIAHPTFDPSLPFEGMPWKKLPIIQAIARGFGVGGTGGSH